MWYKIAAYADHMDKIENASKANKYPFAHWFGDNGRVYLDFKAPELNSEELMSSDDQFVMNFFQENGYPIADYRGGYLQTGAKVGKALNSIQKNKINDLTIRQQNGEEVDIEQETMMIQDEVNRIRNIFTNSQYRNNKSIDEYYVVISQDPHDIGAMSTDQNWVSCMDLDSGSNRSEVYKEVATGGLVSYLIVKEDVEISDPISRIHIRRFENRKGESIAIPEKSVYGNDTPGYHQFVQQWLDSMQPDKKSGMYQMQGGSWSDSFGDLHTITPKNQEEVLAWLRGDHDDAQYSTWTIVDELAVDRNEQISEGYEDGEQHQGGWHENEGIAGVEDHSKTFESKEEADSYLAEIRKIVNGTETDAHERDLVQRESYLSAEWTTTEDESEDGYQYEEGEGSYSQERFNLVENATDNRVSMKNKAIEKILKDDKGAYAPEVLNEIKDYLLGREFTAKGSLCKTFIKKFPELMSKEDIGGLCNTDQLEFIKDLPEEKLAPYRVQWLDAVDWELDMDNLLGVYSIQQDIEAMNEASDDWMKEDFKQRVSQKVLDSISENIFTPLNALFKPIPEGTIQKVVGFIKEVTDSKYLAGTEGKDGFKENWHKGRILAETAKCFQITESDSPTVQNFYTALLPLWDDKLQSRAINLQTLGKPIAALGENGQQFIPFIQQKISDEEARIADLRIRKNEAELDLNSTSKPGSRSIRMNKLTEINKNIDYSERRYLNDYRCILESLISKKGSPTENSWYGSRENRELNNVV